MNRAPFLVIASALIACTLIACGYAALNASRGGSTDGAAVEGRLAPRGGWTWASPPPFGDDILSLWSPGPGQVWAGTTSKLLQYDGAAWTAFDFDQVLSISGRSHSDVWITTGPTVFHWNGSDWSATAPAPRALVLALLAPAGDTGVWALGYDLDGGAVGCGTLLRYSEGVWSMVSEDGDLRAIWASPDGEIWATGWSSNSDTVVVRVKGGAVEASSGPGFGFVTLWGAGSRDVWSASAGSFYHWNGESWTSFAAPPSLGYVSAFWGSGPADVYAAGSRSMAHWDGKRWSTVAQVAHPITAGLTAAAGSSASDVWVAGSSGLLLHFDGGGWARRPVEHRRPLRHERAMDSLRSSLGREHRDQRQGASGKSGAAQEATHVDLPEGDL